MNTGIKSRLETRLRDTPLRRKLTFTVELTGVGAIIFAGVVLFAYQAYTLRQQFQVEIETLTRMVANYAVAPVSFEDEAGMSDVLSALDAREEIQRAELLDPAGKRLASFGDTAKTLNTANHPLGATYDGWRLISREPLRLQGEVIGELTIAANFQPRFYAALSNFIPALLLVALVSLAGIAVITRFSARVLLGGLSQLTSSSARIASTGDYTVRAPGGGADEVGQLTAAFNRMLDELQSGDSALRATNDSLAAEIAERKRLERALVTSSRLAGMAEVSTGVLHNVGNVLNSVNISTQMLRDRLEVSRVRSLAATAELMQPHLQNMVPFLTEDPRGKLIPRFVTELSRQLTAERQELLTEVQSLAGNIEHIKEIVSTQQDYARTGGVSERIDPADLIEDALRINHASSERHSVTIIRRSLENRPLQADRHRLLQIIVNLLSNAIQAVKACAKDRRIVEISTEVREATLAIIVHDHGVGIEPQNLTRIFQHGFTTRPDGHGFGLHSGANAARSLGGSLLAESEGPDRGATFTLTIPLPAPVAIGSATAVDRPTQAP